MMLHYMFITSVTFLSWKEKNYFSYTTMIMREHHKMADYNKNYEETIVYYKRY